MSLNKGHEIKVDDITLIVTHDAVVFRGKCGEKFHISPDEWKKLRPQINRAMQRAKQTPMSGRERRHAEGVKQLEQQMAAIEQIRVDPNAGWLKTTSALQK